MSQQKRSKPLTHSDYTVGWVCALPKERTAATAMLDERHPKLAKPAQDPNAYAFGSIGKHNVVIACLPKGKIGNNPAAVVAAWMTSTFTIKLGLIVGIGGGIPPKVRLGDVVVGTPVGQFPGVVQWDMGKAEMGGKFERTGALDNPPLELLNALVELETEHELNGSKIPDYLKELKEKWPRLAPKYLKSDSLEDVLYKAKYDHVDEDSTDDDTAQDEDAEVEDDEAYDDDGEGQDEEEEEEEEDEEEESCKYCDQTKVVKRKPREMRVHYGLIASGNQVIKNGTFRDKLNKDLGGHVLCVEMEAAGVLSAKFPCIVIRGICDYADSHKNKAWQKHAAAVAAAFAKEFLSVVDPGDVEQLPVIQVLKQFHRDEETQKILNWISPIDFRDKHTEILRDRAKDSGTWILRDPSFFQWTEGKETTDNGKILWCYGMAGAGKTVLAAIVSNYLRDEYFKHHPNIGIATLYCDYQKKDKQDLANLERGIFHQALEYMDEIPDDIRNIYTSARTQPPPPPDVSSPSSVFRSFTSTLSTLFVVLDALDEASEVVQDSIVKRILQLPFSDIRLFCTSRQFSKFEQTFQGFPCIEIRATDDDITTFVKTQIEERARLHTLVKDDEELQKEIVNKIIDKANGMFLIARLHMDSVMFASSKTDIRDALEDLSSGIDETYQKAMLRIRSQSKPDILLAERTLTLVFGCRRLLNTLELRHSLAVLKLKPDQDRVINEDLPLEEIIISVCQGLVIQEKRGFETTFIRPVHNTTSDYFTRKYVDEFPDGHAEIARACVTYLSLSGLARILSSHLYELDKQTEDEDIAYHYGGQSIGPRPEPWKYPPRIRKSFPLFFYAGEHWAFHLCQSRLPISTSSIFWQYQENGFKWAGWLAPPRASYHAKWYDDIYKTIRESHDAVLTLLERFAKKDSGVKKNYDFNLVDDSGRTMLFYAINAGHEEAAKFLLALDDIELTQPDLEINDPLSAAIDRNLQDVAQVLLSMIIVRYKEDGHEEQAAGEGSRRPGRCYSPERLRSLQIKASKESRSLYGTKLLRMLLDKTKDFDPQGGREFLLLAMDKGSSYNSELLTFLLERGLDLQGRDESGNSALHIAAKGNEYILDEKLLQLEADVGAVNSLGHTPLQTAIDCGSFFVFLQLLKSSTPELRRSLKLDEKSKIWSEKYEDRVVEKRVISLLIQEEFTLAKDSGGRTALSLAAEYSKAVAMGFLLQLDWDLNSCDDSGRTALSYAAAKNYEACYFVEKLLKAGADPDIKDKLGKTPLLYAAECLKYHYRFVIIELLKGGADSNAKDTSRTGALERILARKNLIQYDTIKVVEGLLEAGMDPNVEFSSGKTALFVMADNAYKVEDSEFWDTILWILLAAGADPNIKGSDGKTLPDYLLDREDPSLSLMLLIHERLKLGGNLDSKDESGKTPLFYITESKIASAVQARMVKALLDAGASPNIQDSTGRTPIFAAGRNRNDDIVWETLVKGGAKLDIRDKFGRMPYNSHYDRQWY